jgi:hypothetical protein
VEGVDWGRRMMEGVGMRVSWRMGMGSWGRRGTGVM